ncbi:choice-of-anchor B family protein [Altibacter sp. HG106]|uniref:choice-of-anchor B family protein n=1 Tax=Altibacter sp. HG106 TaxID=3023937 RepID=UPI00235028CA|nr:choice-of-anchor B family protein [Altibacter sp. HG106]MDC7995154.1 choice-of-anchor B family protein [Altibacter sp. HG106]
MKHFLLLFLSLSTTLMNSQTPCEGGTAAGFDCNDYDLIFQASPGEMDASFGNDSWGWTDPDTGIEYALIGLDNGTAFFDLSDPVNAVYLGKLPTHTDPSTWRDIKVYENYAFIVSEATGHGMQVFDLTRLRNVTNPPETFTEDAHYDAFGNAHNLVINTETGYAYAVGTTTFDGGPHFVNIQDPLNPTAAGGYQLDGYSHDGQVVTYNGPDTDYTGREIFIGSNGAFGSDDKVAVVDVTDKNNPIDISEATYSNMGYTHQGWFTEDQRYFLLGDEFDESDIGFTSRTIIIDMTDLDNPVELFEYFGPNASIDHNGYVKGDLYYLANYSSGLRVIDISSIGSQSMTEVGFFDTYPPDNDASFAGAWNVYPFFDSDNIVISGDAGFTLVRQSGTFGEITQEDPAQVSLFPNPTQVGITISGYTQPIQKIAVYNVLGQQVMAVTGNNSTRQTFSVASLPSGIYLVSLNETDTYRLLKE